MVATMNTFNFQTHEAWSKFVTYCTYIFFAIYFVAAVADGVLQTSFILTLAVTLYMAILTFTTYTNRKLIIDRRGKKGFYVIFSLSFLGLVYFLQLFFTQVWKYLV